MLDRLRHFLLVVEHGTFTEAARRAHLTQPALSASIRRLEEEVGARVLHRGPGGARVSAEGTALLPHARACVAAAEDGVRAVAEVAGLHAGEVRLGAGPTACTYLLPSTLAAFRERFPAVRYLLREGHNPELWDALAAGDLDLVLVPDSSVPGGIAGLEAEPAMEDELIVVCAPERLAVAGEAPWVTFAAGSTTRALLERHFLHAQIVMELGSIAAVKGNVRAGIGRCLVSRAAVTRDLEDGQLVEVPDARTPIPRRFVLAHRGRDRLPPAARELRAMLIAD